METCECKKPKPVQYKEQQWCRVCDLQLAESISIPVQSRRFYDIRIHTWGGGGQFLPIHYALLYYVLVYPLFSFFVLTARFNDWWESLFAQPTKRKSGRTKHLR